MHETRLDPQLSVRKVFSAYLAACVMNTFQRVLFIITLKRHIQSHTTMLSHFRIGKKCDHANPDGFCLGGKWIQSGAVRLFLQNSARV
jgi:hypothetical protein